MWPHRKPSSTRNKKKEQHPSKCNYPEPSQRYRTATCPPKTQNPPYIIRHHKQRPRLTASRFANTLKLPLSQMATQAARMTLLKNGKSLPSLLLRRPLPPAASNIYWETTQVIFDPTKSQPYSAAVTEYLFGDHSIAGVGTGAINNNWLLGRQFGGFGDVGRLEARGGKVVPDDDVDEIDEKGGWDDDDDNYYKDGDSEDINDSDDDFVSGGESDDGDEENLKDRD